MLQAHSRPEGGAEAAHTILDVGCGSGAIGLALLHSMSDSTCVAIDVSAEAVALATENAAHCGVARRYTAQLVAGGIASYGGMDGNSSQKTDRM